MFLAQLTTDLSAEQVCLVQSDSLFDVFPLRKGLRYTYAFELSQTSSDGWDFSSVSKKGVAKYVVLGSQNKPDSVRVWSLREIIEGTYHGYSKGMNPPIIDTSYSINDTSIVQIAENLRGRHELVCNTTLMNFPITNHCGSVTMPVYRYHDSSRFYIAVTYADWCRGGDTIEFTSLYGLKRRSFANARPSIITFGTGISITAIHDPISQISVEPVQSSISMLEQNYPNPFNSATIIRYYIPASALISLKVYNMLGQCVKVICEGFRNAGSYQEALDASRLPSGMYFYVLNAEEYRIVKKLMIVR